MEILKNIPFSLDAANLMEQLHIEPGSDDEADLRSMMAMAVKVGRPKAVYTASFVDGRDGDTVKIDGVSFTSRALSRNLASVERIFPVIATCGTEMDEAYPPGSDMLKDFWWDLIKTNLLTAAHKYLDDHLHRKFRLGKTSTMRPGSGDANVWPIEQQVGLFSLLGDVEQAIGVKLTRSFLMVPNKTTSGVLFPTEVDFKSCEVCHRENCPARHAAFNKTLWEEIQHD